MPEPTYSVRTPDGRLFTGVAEGDVCNMIVAGELMLDAMIATEPSSTFAPITQLTVFARAFEARMGVGGPSPRGSDSTPVSGSSQRKAHLLTAVRGDSTAQDGTTLSEGAEEPFGDPDPQGWAWRPDPPRDPEDPTPVALTSQEIQEGSTEIGSIDDDGLVTAYEPDTGDVAPDTLPSTRGIDEPEGHDRDHDDPSTPVDEHEGIGSDQDVPSTSVHEHQAIERDEDDPSTPVTLASVAQITPMSPLSSPSVETVEQTDTAITAPPAGAVDLGFVSPAELPIDMPGTPVPIAKEPLRRDPSLYGVSRGEAEQILQMALGLGAWAVSFAVLYAGSLALGLGVYEAAMNPVSTLFWVRVLLVGGAGLALVIGFSRALPISARDFSAPPVWMAVALASGVVFGWFAPSPEPTLLAGALFMGTAYALTEEIFFRAYLGRVLERTFSSALWPTLIGALLYGVYYSTFYAVWVGRTPIEVVLWLAMITVGAGVPYCLLYYLTRSLTVPFVCHLAVNVTMILSAGAHR